MTSREFWVLAAMLAVSLAFAAGYLTGFLRSYRRGLVRGMSTKQQEWEEWLNGQEAQPVQQYDEFGWAEAGHPETQQAHYDGRHRG